MSSRIFPVSVLMSVYNAEKYLAEAIDSILTQIFGDFEFIIINDASTDNSLRTIREFMVRDERIRLIENDRNIGLALSLNKGIDAARGKYIARMDADDISLPGRLGMQFEYLEENPDVWILGGNHKMIDGYGNLIGDFLYPLDQNVLRWNMLLGHGLTVSNGAAMIRKQVFDMVGKFQNLPAAQDFDLWTRFFDYEKLPIRNLSDVIYQYRWHPENVSRKSRSTQYDISNSIRAGLCSKFLGRTVPIEVIQSYRATSFIYDDIRTYIRLWIEIYEKFIASHGCTDSSRIAIYHELLDRIGKYVSFNLVHFFSRNRLCFFREMFNLPPRYGWNLFIFKLRKLASAYFSHA